MKGTKFITEGAILLALYTVLLLAFLYVPLVGGIIIFVLPLPFIIYTVRNSVRNASVLLVIALFVTVIVSTPLHIVNTMMAGITGITLGYMYKRQKSAVEIVLVGMFIYVVQLVLLYVISVKFFDINIVETLKNTYETFAQQTEKMMEAAGKSITDEQRELFKEAMDLLVTLLPTMFVIVALFYSWVTVLFSNHVLKRLKYTVQPFRKFRDMQMPKSIIWYYVAVIILSLFVKVEEGTYSYMAFSNLSIMFNFLLLFQGFSFISFFVNKKGYSKSIPILIFVIGMFIPQLFPLVTILGIIDLGFSLRSKIQFD